MAALALCTLVGRAPAFAQPTTEKTTNPLAGDAKAVDAGKNIYRGRCGVCHGIDAKGYRGSDLTTGDWVHGGGDAQIFRTIARGIPGTEMPGHANMSEEEVWMVIAYLRTLSSPGGAAAERGDATRGEQIYQAKNKGNCAQCHMIDGRGGRLGPNLSRIGASRSAAALEREIRRPGEVIPVGFETVTVVMPEGAVHRREEAKAYEATSMVFAVPVVTLSAPCRRSTGVLCPFSMSIGLAVSMPVTPWIPPTAKLAPLTPHAYEAGSPAKAAL